MLIGSDRMNRKKIIALFLFIVGIILLIIGLFIVFDKPTMPAKKEQSHNEEVIDSVLVSIKEMANNTYGGEGKKVKVDDEKEKYVIYVSDASTNKLLNTFYMDKETMVITEKPIVIEQSASS